MNNRGIDNHNPTDIILDRAHIFIYKDVVQLHKNLIKKRVAELVIDLNTKFRSSLENLCKCSQCRYCYNGMNKSTGIDFICRK